MHFTVHFGAMTSAEMLADGNRPSGEYRFRIPKTHPHGTHPSSVSRRERGCGFSAHYGRKTIPPPNETLGIDLGAHIGKRSRL